MPKHDKPIIEIPALRSNRDHYRHWETRFRDCCLLEGYRNPSKDRLTETAANYMAAKRPFELAILRNAIPATKWNTSNDVIASKMPDEDAGKPRVWFKKIKELYVGASTFMKERHYFWAKLSQADQTSISTWATAVRTAARGLFFLRKRRRIYNMISRSEL